MHNTKCQHNIDDILFIIEDENPSFSPEQIRQEYVSWLNDEGDDHYIDSTLEYHQMLENAFDSDLGFEAEMSLALADY